MAETFVSGGLREGDRKEALKPLKSVTLSGKRVLLRPPVMTDYEELTALIRKSRRLYQGFVAMPFRNRKQFAEYAKRSRAGDKFRFLICRKDDGVIVGSIGLFQIVRLSLQNGVVGYMVGAPFARQGFATEALRLVLGFAFKSLKLHRIEANIQPNNTASIALVKRVGFRCEGRSPRYLKIHGKWRDHERWAILAEDWRKLRPKIASLIIPPAAPAPATAAGGRVLLPR